MKKLWRKLETKRWFQISKAIVAIITILAALSGSWTAVYYGTSALYRWIGWQPDHYWEQMINMFLGLVLLFAIMQIIMLFVGHRHVEISRSLTEAMRRIAKGDFKVRLEVGNQDRGPFEHIIHEINHMAVELDEMEQLRQEFISDVSHEIQSPLTSISGFARALRNEQLPREMKAEYLRIIESESIRLSKLSDNLLKLASLESDKHPFEPKRYRLDRQLGSLILACEPQWVEKSIEMNVDLDENFVVADEDLMSQVWINLISNAIKFTPNGGTIHIELRLLDGALVFKIQDTGIGISEESRELIFQRFYKADKSRNRKAGGSGLGLSLVKKIVQLHNGCITVESTIGNGATFKVTLPQKANEEINGT
ncbi:cell wall metabolism sensor histidine kinase WalK [Paenibacillus sp. NEAU-GSW1]|uniref:sensor histidine kinase n=1 Tax=Paenibacillus sp. NEAU-GSW1 TaxID=2682486 RepID=UPI0012E113E7|nr:HAMP domain-containing sensor histidine kinase [Paenibacillus sp. NEAU-GSW1]MUT68146.1 two-component sensor histidine kinase [Paenibacillus sp. NEAU-GSW1]